MPKKIISVVGARPNFMKMAPLHKIFMKLTDADGQLNFRHLICHTGQHYDNKMSKVFFEDLELPAPDFYLGVGSGSHAEQTAKIMVEFEKIILSESPDLVIVYGDVNSTVACALTAVKLNIKLAHVEAGLRSFDRSMPEELNRIVTDHLADYLFVTEQSGIDNLKKEGIDGSKIFFVGNTMIDSLAEYIPIADTSDILKTLSVQNSKYILVTLHRPSNIENNVFNKNLVDLLNAIAEDVKIIFPIHPRTKKNFSEQEIINNLSENILITEPISYINFIALIKNSVMVITDSGGLQEETTFLGIPCITLRENTERPVTIESGTNVLTGNNFDITFKTAKNILKGNIKSGKVPYLWDGKAAGRITDYITGFYK